ncbi:unnamed protein product [Vitrella brassicaformis CCMP3155]|uniref:Uncharacterized protein n=1 Tax=Vitrella brassicaformis (strain CCMP3155) TaxID=1169540 RepID=A0A0G4GFN3_VITBC|nr:unnamed protein product [Vitrella brassicaformis CCMP3155]|eukprot:CEM28337.1 unnamed protein product [Vitrella brassicaformis CCMP3155]
MYTGVSSGALRKAVRPADASTTPSSIQPPESLCWKPLATNRAFFLSGFCLKTHLAWITRPSASSPLTFRPFAGFLTCFRLIDGVSHRSCLDAECIHKQVRPVWWCVRGPSRIAHASQSIPSLRMVVDKLRAGLQRSTESMGGFPAGRHEPSMPSVLGATIVAYQQHGNCPGRKFVCSEGLPHMDEAKTAPHTHMAQICRCVDGERPEGLGDAMTKE